MDTVDKIPNAWIEHWEEEGLKNISSGKNYGNGEGVNWESG
jgi:hypothetical protein